MIDREDYIPLEASLSVKGSIQIDMAHGGQMWAKPIFRVDSIGFDGYQIYRVDPDLYDNLTPIFTVKTTKPITSKLTLRALIEEQEKKMEEYRKTINPKSFLKIAAETNLMSDKDQTLMNAIKSFAISNKINIYLVGGAVRDMVMGLPANDLDFVLEAKGFDDFIDKLKQLKTAIGAEKVTPIPHMNTAKLVKDGVAIDFALPRTEAYEYPGYQPTSTRHVEGEKSVNIDARRRDFGANALYIRLNDDQFLDPTGHGVKDIQDKVLRISDPKQEDSIFRQDPTRMLRAIRIALARHFTIDPGIVDSIKRMHGELARVHVDDVRNELIKILETADDVEYAINFLVDTGLNKYIFPELEALKFEIKTPHHLETPYVHSVGVANKIPKSKGWKLRMKGLLHDIGKRFTHKIIEEESTFREHEDVGAELAEVMLRRLQFPENDIKEVTFGIKNHMRPHGSKAWTDKAFKKFVKDMDKYLDDQMDLTMADATAREIDPKAIGTKTIDESVAENEALVQRIKDYRKDLIDNPQHSVTTMKPLVDGIELQKMYNKGPGPWIKDILAYEIDKQLEDTNITKEKMIEEIQSRFGKEIKSWLEASMDIDAVDKKKVTFKEKTKVSTTPTTSIGGVPGAVVQPVKDRLLDRFQELSQTIKNPKKPVYHSEGIASMNDAGVAALIRKLNAADPTGVSAKYTSWIAKTFMNGEISLSDLNNVKYILSQFEGRYGKGKSIDSFTDLEAVEQFIFESAKEDPGAALPTPAQELGHIPSEIDISTGGAGNVVKDYSDQSMKNKRELLINKRNEDTEKQERADVDTSMQYEDTQAFKTFKGAIDMALPDIMESGEIAQMVVNYLEEFKPEAVSDMLKGVIKWLDMNYKEVGGWVVENDKKVYRKEKRLPKDWKAGIEQLLKLFADLHEDKKIDLKPVPQKLGDALGEPIEDEEIDKIKQKQKESPEDQKGKFLFE